MKVNEFLKDAEKTYKMYFPKSKCLAIFNKSLYRNMSIDCYLAAGTSECMHGYLVNDMFSVSFSIDTEGGEFSKLIDSTSELPTNLVLAANSKSYSIKPETKYLAYSRKTVPFRKVVGDPKKLLTALDKFFNKLKNEVLKDADKNIIHDNYKKIVEEKVK